MKSYFFPYIVILSSSIFVTTPANSDARPYDSVRRETAHDGLMTCTHWHDFMGARNIKEKLFKDPFDKYNEISWVHCEENGKTLFKVPTPPLTVISIAQGFFVGASNIKYANRFQYIVLNKKGHLVLGGHISSFEACFLREEWAITRAKFRISSDGGSAMTNVVGILHLDYRNNIIPFNITQEMKDYFRTQHSCTSHISPFFSESTSNFIDWFHKTDPSLTIVFEKDTPKAVRVRDPAGVLITAP